MLSLRELVIATYKPPQISQTDVLTTIMERYGYSYRRMFIEQPRIRLDGVYIAICHYVFVPIQIFFTLLVMMCVIVVQASVKITGSM
jgi:hypothetical protein